MNTRTTNLAALLLAALCVGLVFCAVPASAGSILGINHNSCPVRLQVYNQNGNVHYGRDLTPLGSSYKSLAVSSVGSIKGGSECGLPSGQHYTTFNFNLNMEGDTWRIEIYDRKVEVYGRQNGAWSLLRTQSTRWSNCYNCSQLGPASATGPAIGGFSGPPVGPSAGQ